jgi:hypothetical protein
MGLVKFTREVTAGPTLWKGARWPREEVRRDILLFIATAVIMDITRLIGPYASLVWSIYVFSICYVVQSVLVFILADDLSNTIFRGFHLFFASSECFRLEHSAPDFMAYINFCTTNNSTGRGAGGGVGPLGGFHPPLKTIVAATCVL